MRSPLARLRLRLTGWYAGGFALLLAALGVSLVLLVRRASEAELRQMLEDTASETVRAAQINVAAGMPDDSALAEAASELDAPEHHVYVVEPGGRTPGADVVLGEGLRRAALEALARGARRGRIESGSQSWRYLAAPFELRDGRPVAVLVLTDAAAPERRFTRIITMLLALGGMALVPVLLGGYALARISTRPVEASVERIRRFTAEAAHELRTPVTIIRTQAELALSRERGAAEYSAALAEIRSEAIRMGNLVADLLTLARWEAGDRPPELQPVFLDDIAEAAVAAATPLASERHVELALGATEEAPVLGDAALLRQVLMILLDNATRFSHEGGRVVVECRVDGRTACLVVADTGVGIPAADLPRVFDRFFRSAGAQAGGGAGLGLALARRIVEPPGGEIALASTVGEGTTVTVRFPKAPGAAA